MESQSDPNPLLFSAQETFEDVTVLLAIEHSASAELLANRLERRGVRVKRVTEGKAALEATEAFSFDVVVAQTGLPGRAGIELLRLLPRPYPAIVLLGREGNDDVVIRAFQLGAADYITRPFSPSVATTRILRLVKLQEVLKNPAPR